MIHPALPHVRESKTVLDSRFHAVDSGFQVLETGLFISGTWIQSHSLNCIQDSQAYDTPWLHIQTFPGFRNPDFLVLL